MKIQTQEKIIIGAIFATGLIIIYLFVTTIQRHHIIEDQTTMLTTECILVTKHVKLCRALTPSISDCIFEKDMTRCRKILIDPLKR